MLVGTLLLGVLLGYLLWGWLKVRVRELEVRIRTMEGMSESTGTELAALRVKVQSLEEENQKIDAALRNKDALYISTLQKLNKAERELEEERAKAALRSTTQIPQQEMETPESEKAAIPTKNVVQSGVSAASLEKAKEVFGKRIKANDLKIIEGIGPKIEQILNNSGIKSWAKLAEMRLPVLRVILEEAGPAYSLHKPKTWPKQARMASKGEWKKLKLYQDKLHGGLEKQD